MSISRRDTLRSLLALGSAAAVVKQAQARTPPVVVRDPRRDFPSTRTATEDAYRAEFAATAGEEADRGFAFHCVNCQGNCAWEVWSEGGKVTRESQSASYPGLRADYPDPNPRGCNKGTQHSQGMYAADRLMYPMRRTGERGAGQWKRISWDEAIDEVARNLYDTMRTVGPQGNYVHIGSGVISEVRGAAFKRLGTLLGAVRPYIASYVGDMFPGVSVVYGEGNLGQSLDFAYQTDVQIYWGCNPNTTRIPDAHYVWEGKYNGSKVVVITPEFSSTAVHADLWVPIKPGYDGHLALSILHDIVEKGLFDPERVKTFTDLPFLVRADTGAMLSLADLDEADPAIDHAVLARMRKGGHEGHAGEIFLAWNTKTGLLTPMPGCEGSPVATLRLHDTTWDIDPALDARRTVKLKDGTKVEVVTGFARLKTQLADYAPDKTRALTGVHPDVVDTLARDLTRKGVVTLTMGFAIGKHWNGMLAQRAIASLVAFTGRLGPEGGLSTENEWSISGLDTLSGFPGRYKPRFASGFVSEFALGGGTGGDFPKAFAEEDVERATGRSKADYARAVDEGMAAARGDAGVGHGKSWWDEVQTFLMAGDSRFRRNKGGYRQAFLKKAKFLAVAEIRMSDTAVWADVLLPCKSHYEVYDLRTNPGYHRFANVAVPPADLVPVGEAKSEWEIATLIAERLTAIAVAEFEKTHDEAALKIADATNATDGFHDLSKVEAEFTDEGKLRTDRDALEHALAHVPQFRGETIASAMKRGGYLVLNEKAGKTSPLYPDKPYSSFEYNLYLHQRFETRSGRLTFYVDHPQWLAAGAALPVATEPLRTKKHPFVLMTPHARWSIHSTYKSSPILLRLQRGVPYVMMNPKEAAERGLADGDHVVMVNDLAEVPLMLKVAHGVQPGTLVMEHGWEPFMFKGKVGQNSLQADIPNLLELSDGWGHLKFGMNWDGNQHAYVATVDVRKA